MIIPEQAVAHLAQKLCTELRGDICVMVHDPERAPCTTKNCNVLAVITRNLTAALPSLMGVHATRALNDPAVNSAIDSKLRTMRARSAQQPVSYKPLFDEAIELATEQFMRAMLAEAAALPHTGQAQEGRPGDAFELGYNTALAFTTPAPQAGCAKEGALAEFARWAISEGPWRGNDLDGDSVQDKAEKLGLLVKTKYDPAIHGDSAEAEPGDDWFVFAPPVAESGWQEISSAPRNATEVELRIPKKGHPGFYRQIAHWADGGGDDQPRFRGWFRDTGYGFAEIGGEPDAWRPAQPLPAPPHIAEGKP